MSAWHGSSDFEGMLVVLLVRLCTVPGMLRVQRQLMTCSYFADMNVGYVLDEAQLTRYFSQYGTVTDCYLPVRTMRASVSVIVL